MTTVLFNKRAQPYATTLLSDLLIFTIKWQETHWGQAAELANSSFNTQKMTKKVNCSLSDIKLQNDEGASCRTKSYINNVASCGEKPCKHSISDRRAGSSGISANNDRSTPNESAERHCKLRNHSDIQRNADLTPNA